MSTPPQQAQPLILPPTCTTTTPPESFPPSPHHPPTDLTWHTLFSTPQTNTSDLSAGIAHCPPHTGDLPLHRHEQAEIYYILDGEGDVYIDGVVTRVQAGSAVFIPSNARHGIGNVGGSGLRFFYVFPTAAFGDVVYRFEDNNEVNGKV